MSRKREQPMIMVRKTPRGIVPLSAFDEERLAELPLGTEFDVKPATRRSWPQLKLYWSILSRVVAATEIAPSAPHLHDLLKIDLGYVTLVRLLDGRLAEFPDSAALDEMKLLAETTGCDPMEFLEERRAA